MTNKTRGFASFDKDRLKAVSAKGGKQSKGRVLTEEHKRKIKETWAKRLAKGDK